MGDDKVYKKFKKELDEIRILTLEREVNGAMKDFIIAVFLIYTMLMIYFKISFGILNYILAFVLAFALIISGFRQYGRAKKLDKLV